MARNSGYKRRRYDEVRVARPLENQRTSMLNLHRMTTFRYELKEILNEYEVSDSVTTSVIASVIAKGSRVSIESARSFVQEQAKTGAYTSEVSDEICNLLDRWARYR